MTEKQTPTKPSQQVGLCRRDFLRAAGRGAALVGLAAAAAALGLRNGLKRGDGGECINAGACSSCSAFAGCDLRPPTANGPGEEGVQ